MTRTMDTWTIDRRPLSDPSWWHWAVTVGLLAAGLAGGSRMAIPAATALCAVMAAWYFARLGRVKPFPVQIRLGYLALLLAGFLPWMGWVYWVQLAGTTAMVTLGYCPMSRILMLMPWNRSEPLTAGYALRTFLAPPGPGGLVMRTAAADAPAAPCSMSCSLAGPAGVASRGGRVV